MIAATPILPTISWGGGPAKLVEGFCSRLKNHTAFHAVPLPGNCRGGCS